MKTNPNDFTQGVRIQKVSECGQYAEIIDHPGLTKREYFAGLVMQALATKWNIHEPEDISFHAIKCADALIKELNKDEQGENK